MRITTTLAMAFAVAAGCSKKNDESPAKVAPAKAEPTAPTTKALPVGSAAQGSTNPSTSQTAPATQGEPAVAKTEPTAPRESPAAKPLFDFKISAKPMSYKAREFIWASYPANKTTAWVYNKVRFKAAKGEWAEVSALSTFVTHSAFLHKAIAPDAKQLTKGTPVKVHVGVGVKYGRVQSVNGHKVKVKFYVSGPKSGERELPLASVELWKKGALDPGVTVLYEDGGVRKLATLMHVEGAKAYITGPKGLQEIDTKAITPVDPSKVFRKGDKAFAYARKGAFGVYKMTEGRITKVHDKGVWYEWKAKKGPLKANVSFAKVVKK